MCRAEGIHYEHVTQRRVISRQRSIVGRFTDIETHILQQHDIARQRRNLSPFGRQQHIAPEELSQSSSNGRHRRILAPFALRWTAKM